MDPIEQGVPILPPQDLERAWSREHLRLHKLLKQQPALLPPQACLLLAVSGGQDSMALLGLLLGLRRLHGWQLHLWHGDHGWRPEAADQARALAAWCGQHQLQLLIDHNPAASTGEASARRWRYQRLAHHAAKHGCSHVVTGHTATDRAETLLLHLARGSHRRGLASLPALRPLNSTAPSGLQLSRPLLIFSRDETAQICRQLELPLWLDPTNADPRFSRNRIRHEVLPVLEQLHPGASRRLSATAGRLQQEQACSAQWLELTLDWLSADQASPARVLQRARLARLHPPNQLAVLAHWFSSHGVAATGAGWLSALQARLAQGQPSGNAHLSSGSRLRWNSSTLELLPGVQPVD